MSPSVSPPGRRGRQSTTFQADPVADGVWVFGADGQNGFLPAQVVRELLRDRETRWRLADALDELPIPFVPVGGDP